MSMVNLHLIRRLSILDLPSNTLIMAQDLDDLAGALGPVAQGELHNQFCPKLQEGRSRW
jgi:hypothetical protein